MRNQGGIVDHPDRGLIRYIEKMKQGKVQLIKRHEQKGLVQMSVTVNRSNLNSYPSLYEFVASLFKEYSHDKKPPKRVVLKSLNEVLFKLNRAIGTDSHLRFTCRNGLLWNHIRRS